MWPFKRNSPEPQEEDKTSMQSARESAAKADRALQAAREQQQRGHGLRDTIAEIRRVNHLSDLFGEEGMGRG